ncbi:MAG: response regulator, partial [Pseudomonadota bacterium]
AEDLKVILGQMGHRVSHVARTRADALVSAQQFQPDLLICDINLADGSSGISAAHAILQTQDIPVLFVTSNPKRLLTGDALEPTFVIEKPYLPAQIRAMVSQVLFFQESQRDCFVDVAI